MSVFSFKMKIPAVLSPIMVKFCRMHKPWVSQCVLSSTVWKGAQAWVKIGLLHVGFLQFSCLIYLCVCVGVDSFFNLPVLTNTLVKSLDKFSFSCALGCPDPIPTHLGSVPIFFPGYLSLVLLLSISFLHFRWTRRSWLTHASLLPSLLHFLHTGIKRSCTQRILSSESCQLFSVPWEQFPRGCHSLIP